MTDRDTPPQALEKSRNGQSRVTHSAREVAELVEQTARAIYDARGPQEMHPGQWSVLRFLARTPVEGRSIETVAAHLGVTPGPASRALSALERRKLVRIRPQAEDRRKREITLTKAGEVMLLQDPLNHFAQLLDEIAPDQLASVGAALTSVRAQLSEPRQR